MRKRHKTKTFLIIIAAVIIAIIAVMLILILSRKGPVNQAASEPETESAAEAESEKETESEGMNQEIVLMPETEPEEPPFEFIDAHGIWHTAEIDENAEPCQYPRGTMSHDGMGKAAYSVDDESDDYYELERGIDVSSHQGDISWYDVRSSGIEYAIIRAAYRGYGESGKLCADEKFEQNYTGAYEVGVRTGAYVFSQAVNEEEAVEEAELVLELLNGRPLDLFIAYDPESVWETEARIDNVTKEQITKNAIAFCDTVAAAGYKPAIYSNMLWEAEKFDMAELGSRYEFWYADYESSPQSPYAFSVWQFSESGEIGGIEGPVDLNAVIEKPREESETEKNIYSYVQIPQEYYENSVWTSRKKCNKGWTGDWAHIEAGGQEFTYFGCGICCISNTVSTLTEFEVDPDEMYYETKDNTGYYPESGLGAVSWGEMKTMCELYGLDAKLRQKPEDYEQFRDDAAASDTAIVVVCQNNDKRLWWYTHGHYVNVWDYDPETDSVFVTDPSMHYNRQRVQLRDIYNALKTANPAQYMCVNKSENAGLSFAEDEIISEAESEEINTSEDEIISEAEN